MPSDTVWPGALDDLTQGDDGSVCNSPSLASILNALQTYLGLTGAPNMFVQTEGGQTLIVPAGETLIIKLGSASLTPFLEVQDQEGNAINFVGIINGSTAGFYESLGNYVDYLSAIGWWGQTDGTNGGSQGYNYFNKYGSAQENHGGQPHFYGNAMHVDRLAAPSVALTASAVANRVFTITPPGSSTYTLSLNGHTTSAIAFGASVSTVQTDLQALPGCSGVTLLGTGLAGTGTPYAVTSATGLGALTSSGATIAETTLTNGDTYYYQACAGNLAGVLTVAGTYQSITTSSGDPAVNITCLQDWGANFYAIYRATSTSGPFDLIAYVNVMPSEVGSDIGMQFVDSGLPSQGSTPPTAPTPGATVLQAWSGEPGTNPAQQVESSPGTVGFARLRNSAKASTPPTTATIQTALGNLALGTAFHNTLAYDVWLTVYLAVTADTSLVVADGVGTTTTPTQTTIITGTTATGIVPIRALIPAGQYRLLSVSGTETSAITGQYLEAAN